MTVQSIAPVLVVEAIEPSVALWVEGLGFRKTAEVPEGNRLGFAMFERDGITVMYQTVASIEREIAESGLPESMNRTPGAAVAFVVVDDVAAVRSRVAGFDVLVPKRETFYGTEELWLREPGGNVIGFAQRK